MRYNEARARLPSPLANKPAANARALIFNKLRLLGLDDRTLTNLLLSVTIFVDHELNKSDPEIDAIHEGMTDDEIIQILSYWIARRLDWRVRDELRNEFFPLGLSTSSDGDDEISDRDHEISLPHPDGTDVINRIFIAEVMERLRKIARKDTNVGKVARAILRDFKNSFENVIKGRRFNQERLKGDCPGINVDEGLRLLKAQIREMRDQPNS
jgi:hypothetical protein